MEATLSEMAIEAHGLTKHFGPIVAVDEIDLEVGQGEAFGFLGPNGAGKTATISMLTTLLKPTAGTAVVGGHDINTDDAGVRTSSGIVFQEQTLDERLTATESRRLVLEAQNLPDQVMNHLGDLGLGLQVGGHLMTVAEDVIVIVVFGVLLNLAAMWLVSIKD